MLLKNTYNIVKKGFIIRAIRKTKRVFNKVLYKKRCFKQASYNTNRE